MKKDLPANPKKYLALNLAYQETYHIESQADRTSTQA